MPTKPRPPARVWTDDERRARVEPIITDWMGRLEMTNWVVSYQFVNKPVQTTGQSVFASITTNDPYRRAVIEYVRPMLDVSTDEEVEISTLHELAHLIIWPATQRIRDLVGSDSWIGSELFQALETACDNVTFRLLTLYRKSFPRPYFDPLDSHGRPT